MKMQNFSFEVTEGNDLRIYSEVRDEDNELVDISAAQKLRWEVARTTTDEPVIVKTLADDIVLTSDSAFYFDLDAADTEGVNGGFYHELELVTDGGKTYTILYGRLYIRPALI